MADFLTVIKEGARMCEYLNRDCNKCKLDYHKNGKYISCQRLLFSYPEEYQDIVVDWSEKHPEPCYPTWEQWQKSVFPNSNSPIHPCAFTKCYMFLDCDQIESASGCSHYNHPIPGDVAVKLGIKPI